MINLKSKLNYIFILPQSLKKQSGSFVELQYHTLGFHKTKLETN